MSRKLKPEITKPYRVPTVENRPLHTGPRLIWRVTTADPKKSFNFSTGSEWQTMKIWRHECGGSEILKISSEEPKTSDKFNRDLEN